MRCPFLREAQVKFCQASPFKKMIVRTLGPPNHERCSSPDYVNCPAARQRQHHEEFPSQTHCPFLTESLVQYCSAASVTKFIPYSESELSRCVNENHRYCELYMALANPPVHGTAPESSAAKNVAQIDGMEIPEHLSYSANHFWLDTSEDGYYHVGIDAFLAKVLGSVDSLSFVTSKGVNRPAAVLTVHGADLQMVFPNSMLIERPNNYLRTHPEKLTSHPYTLGWLFEGSLPKAPAAKNEAPVNAGLIREKDIMPWMKQEMHRLSTFVHEQLAHHELQGQPLMADGGAFCDGLMQHLNRDDILHLFNEFFSPYASWRKPS